MLERCGIISSEELKQIDNGLEEIADTIRNGTFKWSAALEDVHMNIEGELVNRIGEVGKKLHTARSRNDQVATDLRLFLRDKTDESVEELKNLVILELDNNNISQIPQELGSQKLAQLYISNNLSKHKFWIYEIFRWVD